MGREVYFLLDGIPCRDAVQERANVAALGLPAPEELGRAGAFLCPGGAAPARGWVLLQRHHLDGLDPDAPHTLTLVDEHRRRIDLRNLVVTQEPRALTSNVPGESATCYLVGLADRRWLCHNPIFQVAANKRYNVRLPLLGGTAYYADSLDTGSPWTWSGMLADLWDLVAGPLATPWPGLPAGFTPDGSPEGYSFQGVSAWAALSHVLWELGLVVRPDLTLATAQYSLAVVGADDGTGAALAAARAGWRKIFDAEYTAATRGKSPRGCAVHFPKNFPGAGAYAVDVDGPDAAAAEPDTYTPLWDELTAVHDVDGSLTNAAALADRAAFRTAAYFAGVRTTGGGRLHQVFDGVLPLAPGGALRGVGWRQDAEGGIVTEAVRHPYRQLAVDAQAAAFVVPAQAPPVPPPAAAELDLPYTTTPGTPTWTPAGAAVLWNSADVSLFVYDPPTNAWKTVAGSVNVNYFFGSSANAAVAPVGRLIIERCSASAHVHWTPLTSGELVCGYNGQYLYQSRPTGGPVVDRYEVYAPVANDPKGAPQLNAPTFIDANGRIGNVDPNVTTARMFLTQDGTGTAANPPFLDTLQATDLPTVPLTGLPVMTAHTLLGNPTGAATTPQEITPGTTLVFSGTSLQTAALTGDVTAAANSFATTLTAGVVTFAKLAAAATDNDPTLAANSSTVLPTQQAVKQYVTGLLSGLAWKPSVRAATTTAGTLSTSFANGSTIDGVTLATGDRVLIKDQAAGAENGLYVVAASGAPARATDADTSAEMLQATTFVREGTAQHDTQWTCTTSPITLGTTALVFAQVSGAGTYNAGTGLQLSGNTFAVDSTVVTLAGVQTLTNKSIDANQLTGTVAAGRMPALTGDVTTAAGTVATAIAARAVTMAKIVAIATQSFLGRSSAGTGDTEVMSIANAKFLLGLSGVNTGDQTITLTGDVTGSGTGSFAVAIAAGAVTYAKMQNTAAASVLLGRGAGSGAGAVQEITLGSGLVMTGTTLSATGASGAVSGSGTPGQLPRWVGTTSLGNSSITDNLSSVVTAPVSTGGAGAVYFAHNLDGTTSGTPADGFGTLTSWRLKSSTTLRQAAEREVSWALAADAARAARVVERLYRAAGASEYFRAEQSAAGVRLSWFAAATALQQSGNLVTALANYGLVVSGNLAFANLTGVAAPSQLGTGTPTSSTVLYGDGTWGALPAAGNGPQWYKLEKNFSDFPAGTAVTLSLLSLPAGSDVLLFRFTYDQAGGAGLSYLHVNFGWDAGTWNNVSNGSYDVFTQTAVAQYGNNGIYAPVYGAFTGFPLNNGSAETLTLYANSVGADVNTAAGSVTVWVLVSTLP